MNRPRNRSCASPSPGSAPLQGVVSGVLLDKMPAAMRKDVDAAIAELPAGKKQPSRWTRREAAERAARNAEAAPMEVDDEGEGSAPGGAEVAVEEEQVGTSRGGRGGGRGWAWERCAASTRATTVRLLVSRCVPASPS